MSIARRRIAGLIGSAALSAALATGAPAASAQGAACANADAQPGSVSSEALADALTCLVNAEREKRGLRALSRSPKLAKAERRHVEDMVENRYISHRGTDGSLAADRARRAGYLRNYKTFVVGEDLAWGQGNAGTPSVVVSAWMRSATHRRNLLDPRYRQFGAAAGTGAPTGAPGDPQSSNAATYGITFGVVKRRK
jgi:uncharacterized protein YkwD